jgi:hypothetical protein
MKVIFLDVAVDFSLYREWLEIYNPSIFSHKNFEKDLRFMHILAKNIVKNDIPREAVPLDLADKLDVLVSECKDGMSEFPLVVWRPRTGIVQNESNFLSPANNSLSHVNSGDALPELFSRMEEFFSLVSADVNKLISTSVPEICRDEIARFVQATQELVKVSELKSVENVNTLVSMVTQQNLLFKQVCEEILMASRRPVEVVIQSESQNDAVLEKLVILQTSFLENFQRSQQENLDTAMELQHGELIRSQEMVDMESRIMNCWNEVIRLVTPLALTFDKGRDSDDDGHESEVKLCKEKKKFRSSGKAEDSQESSRSQSKKLTIFNSP